jgi:deazaflavin-dependent oxidoreductase (nitroreductase family)
MSLTVTHSSDACISTGTHTLSGTGDRAGVTKADRLSPQAEARVPRSADEVERRCHRSRHTGIVPVHYRAPGWFTRNVFNRAVAFLTRHGVSVLGSRVLAVRGRTSGVWRTTPVNLLDYRGQRYLVSARGEGQWVRNLRVAGIGELRVGQRTEPFRGRELPDEEKVPVLRAYLKRWKFEVGAFFEGVGPDSSDAEILGIAAKHPAFEVLPIS